MSNESRLPAGSTLEIAPGVHVAHPHAEVNLPGQPDPRVAGTDAVTESIVNPVEKTKAELKFSEQKPLADAVIPSTLTTVNGKAVLPVKVGEQGTATEPPQAPAAEEGEGK